MTTKSVPSVTPLENKNHASQVGSPNATEEPVKTEYRSVEVTVCGAVAKTKCSPKASTQAPKRHAIPHNPMYSVKRVSVTTKTTTVTDKLMKHVQEGHAIRTSIAA